jgi:hypothetical protein
MRKILTSFTLSCLLSFASQAQSAAEKEVASAVESLRKAMIEGSRTQLESIASSSLSYGHSSGVIENKAAFVEGIASGKSDFVSIDLTEQTISISNSIAIVRHKLSGEINDGGKPNTLKLGVLLIWQKEKDQWKLLARQAFKL